MFDDTTRRWLAAPLEGMARVIDRPGVTPDLVTLLGGALGIGAAVAAASAWWWLALALWLLRCVADGVDGPLARRRARGSAASGAGGFLDITVDFIVYGTFVVGVGIGVDDLLPFMAVLLAYYVNGAAFLAFSSIAERTGRPLDDGRSLSFLGGLAEGTETVVVHALWCIVPGHAAPIAWVWAAVVGASAIARIVAGYRLLR